MVYTGLFNPTSSPVNYGIVGWLRRKGDTPSGTATFWHKFREYRDGANSASISRLWSYPTADAYNYTGTTPGRADQFYSVYFNQSNSQMTFDDGDARFTMGINTYVPNQARSYAVITNFRSAMPGRDYWPLTFKSAHIRYGGADYPFDGTPHNSDWYYYGVSKPASGSLGYELRVWDHCR